MKTINLSFSVPTINDIKSTAQRAKDKAQSTINKVTTNKAEYQQILDRHQAIYGYLLLELAKAHRTIDNLQAELGESTPNDTVSDRMEAINDYITSRFYPEQQS